MSVMETARVGFWDGAFIPPTPRSPATVVEMTSPVVVVEEETPQLDYLAQGIADITQRHVPLEDLGALLDRWREADGSSGSSGRGGSMISRLREHTGPRDAATLVGAYLERLDERTVQLREALEGWRGADAADIAHSIIEATRAFEADEVMAACASIEMVAGLGPCSVTMSTIDRLERANQDLRATLSAA